MQKNFKKSEMQTIIFDGLNTMLAPGFELQDGELTYVRNMDCHNSPTVLSTRQGRAVYASAITTPNALGVRANDKLHVQDGSVWKRWDGAAWQNVRTGLTSSAGKIFDFVGASDVFTILVNGTNVYKWDGSSASSIAAAPASKLYVSHKYRLFAATEKSIKASDLGDITTWPVANEIPVTNAKGELLALNIYANHIVVFSEFSMHELYGLDENDWNLVDVADIGCISDRSVINHKGKLWFIGVNGNAYRYDGGRPVLISDKISQDYLEDLNYAYKHLCCAGAVKNSIFWSIPHGDSTTNNMLLELRVDLGRWYVHTGSIVQFANIGNNLYGMATDGTIYNMRSGTDDAGEAIEFSAVTKPFHEMSLTSKKSLRYMYIVVDLPSGSTLTIYGSKKDYGDSDWVTLQSFDTSSDLQNQQVLIPTDKMQLANWFRLKFEGTGPCDIYYLVKATGKRGGFF